MTERVERVFHALAHVRHALIALKADAPTLPALLCAEEELVRALFTQEEADEYLTSTAVTVYGRVHTDV